MIDDLGQEVGRLARKILLERTLLVGWLAGILNPLEAAGDNDQRILEAIESHIDEHGLITYHAAELANAIRDFQEAKRQYIAAIKEHLAL